VSTKELLVIFKALAMLLAVCAVAAICVFIAAGSLNYWNGWICIIEFYVFESSLAGYLFRKDPGLLMKRLNAKEQNKKQKSFTSLAYIVIALCVLIVPGLDQKYAWSQIPNWISIIFTVIMGIGFVFQFVIVKQNSFIYRTIEVTEKQVVIDSGLYSRIRHPMYLFGMIIVISMPVILGSLYSTIILILFLLPLFILRIHHEEILLRKELNGYSEYCNRVKYRLIPNIW
jgi:protein-S-isoprenylcysteine O-methyltransferase Ste14